MANVPLDRFNNPALMVVIVDPETGDFVTPTVVAGSTVEVTASALPTGASTEAKQDDAITQLTALNTAIGATDDAAWNGTDANASVISILKAISLATP